MAARFYPHRASSRLLAAFEHLEDRRLFALVAPTDVQAVPVGADQVNVTWKDTNSVATSGTQETGYKVERKVASAADSTFAQVGATTAADVTSFADDTVVANTAYAYRVLAVAGATSGPASTPAQATPSATVSNDLTFGGSATAAGETIQLTDNVNNQVGSVFTSTARPITSDGVSRLISAGSTKISGFTASFEFTVPEDGQTDPPAEGFAFVIQRNSPKSIGTGGSGLGYEGMPNSLAVKFDFIEGGGADFKINQTGIYADGQMDDFGIDTNFDFTNGDTYRVELEYNDGLDRLQMRVTDVEASDSTTYNFSQVLRGDGVLIPLDIDDNVLFGTSAFFGFVGSTGEEFNSEQLIKNFKINGGAINLPAPSAVDSVYLAGSAWTAPFKSALATAQLGDATLGYRLGSQPAATPISYTNLNRVTVKYSAPVTSAPAASALTILSSRGNYTATAVTLAADGLSATFTLDHTIGLRPTGGVAGGERLQLKLAGLGASGADFVQEFITLPGDANQSGIAVNSTDLVLTRNRVGRTAVSPGTGTTAYTLSNDFDGNAAINATDLVLVRNRVGNTIPPAPTAVFASTRIAPPRASALAQLREDDVLA